MYKYKINGIKNKQIKELIISAKNIDDARSKALSKKITPLSVEKCEKVSLLEFISEEDIILSFEQITLLMQSYLPLDEIFLHCANTPNNKLNLIFKEIVKRLKKGATLSESFRAFGNSLKPIHYFLIEIGEKTGKLQENFLLIKKDLLRQNTHKKELKKAMFYPAIVFISIILAFFTAIVFIIPEFQNLFASSQNQLPWITQSLIYLASFIKLFFIPIVVFFSIIMILFWLFYKNQKFKFFIHKILLRLPIMGKITLFYRLEIFFQSLYFFQTAGIDIKTSLKESLGVLDNLCLEWHFQQNYKMLDSGKNLIQSFEKNIFLDSITLTLLESGEKSGKLDEIFSYISQHYHLLYKDKLEKFFIYLEPLATFLSALFILYLALGIFLPIWELQELTF